VTKYETTFILEPGLDENRVNEEIERVSQWIRELGGEVVDVQRWGKRRLAYEIRKKRDGIYTLIVHESPGPVVKEIERRMSLNESYMRVLSVLFVPPDPVPVAGGGETVRTAAGEDGPDE
jgi:small subunit ribosomal protein S6